MNIMKKMDMVEEMSANVLSLYLVLDAVIVMGIDTLFVIFAEDIGTMGSRRTRGDRRKNVDIRKFIPKDKRLFFRYNYFEKKYEWVDNDAKDLNSNLYII